MKKSLIITGIFGIVFLVMLITFVSAHSWACLTYGDSVPYYTCHHDTCKLCLNDNGYSTSFGYCDNSPQCDFGPPVTDLQPPDLTIKSPVNNEIYNSRSVLFDLKTDEPSSLYYIDSVNGRGRWSRLSSNRDEYSRKISFKDGLNKITIKAEDKHGNFIEINKSFYVDSKKPKITKTLPRKGFSNGTFEVWFTEENPKSLVLNYGNLLKGKKNATVNISDCILDRGKYYCSVDVNLIIYNGQDIEYSFKLTDIAEGVHESKIVRLSVDISKPVINNPELLFTQGEGRYNKYISFKINITEKNLDRIYYIDNYDKKPRLKSLCSRLKNGVCEKRISFSKGEHDVDILVFDDAGNFAIKELDLFSVI